MSDPKAPAARPKMISDYQAEFFDNQRKQGNIFNDMVQEVLGLNQVLIQKIAELETALAQQKAADVANAPPKDSTAHQ